MSANDPRARTTGSALEPRESLVRKCVEDAARRAARSIPHFDVHSLQAILAAHVELTMARFRGEAPLEHWLNRVLRNKVIDLVKFERGSPHETPALDAEDLDLVDPRSGPEREATLGELRALIEDEYGETREGRILLLLLSGEVTTVTQAAKLLGWNHPTALARVRRHPVVLGLRRGAV